MAPPQFLRAPEMTLPRTPEEMAAEKAALQHEIARIDATLRCDLADYYRRNLMLSRNLAVARLWSLDGRTDRSR